MSPVADFENLSQPAFCGDYGEAAPDWRIGPFVQDESMTFTKTRPWDDPTGIGWTSSVLANPTMIEHEGLLHMFYRANPSKESLGGRVGHAVFGPDGRWTDLSGPPVLYPETSDEVGSLEDPKIYRVGEVYHLFYNSVWFPEPSVAAAIRQGGRDWGATVVTKHAVSRDLVHFDRLGQVVPYEVSQGWSKGAVIPRSPHGEAVPIRGRYLMFLSEGCGDRQVIGSSVDMIDWEFEAAEYLTLPKEMGRLAEVACCVADFEPTGRMLVLDFFYRDPQGEWRAGQALYDHERLDRPLEICTGGSLAWGGLLRHQGAWLVMQGWDSPADRQEMYAYRSRS
ncbi:MAG: hypothetical protein MH204_02160 [Fimbriimonadaceae bacterium]|nr:hypothetical protein [Fimbriimonadaceae bacterium]